VTVANPFMVNGDAEKRRAEAAQYAREIEHLTASLRNLGEYYPDFHAPIAARLRILLGLGAISSRERS
jgi:hypothetical protein